MADIPTPRSYPAILGEQLDAFLSKTGLPSIKVGSPVLSFLEATSQSDLRNSQDIFAALDVDSIDRADASALDRIGRDERVPRITEKPSSGTVTVTDTSFTKKNTRLYQGKPAPIAGSTTIYVVDASTFPGTGSIYLGRGTSNYEGPIAYTSAVNGGTYWTITLSTATQRFHNSGESVVLAQGGDRVISSGATCQTPPGNAIDAVQFSVVYNVTLPDGEVSVSGVLVQCQKPGVIGNVPAITVNSWVSPPFVGAAVSNPLPFSNGLPTEDDKSYRERIKNAKASRAKGTPLAIKTAAIGISASDENKTVVSASLVAPQGQAATLFIDDGTGYEQRASGVAIEAIVDQALGGETFFQTAQRPVAKAFITCLLVVPFALAAGDSLAVKVGGVLSTHTFDSASFRDIANATAYETVASINANASLLFSARTVNQGNQFVIFAKADTNEDIEVVAPSTGVDANQALGFPLGRVDTIKLYKNDILLVKDGSLAQLSSNPQSHWGALSGSQTLTVAVDSTPAVTYTFTDTDFISLNTSYTTLGTNSLAAWAAVFNARIPGITAVVANGLIVFTSNRGRSATASLSITGGSLVGAQMFGTGAAAGSNSDYTFNVNTAEGNLAVPLAAGDRLSAGTINTRAFVQSAALGTININSPGAAIWAVVDGDAQVLPLGINSSTSLNLQITGQGTSYWGNRVRLAAADGVTAIAGTGVNQLAAGDWLILYDAAFNANNAGSFRVSNVDAGGTWLEIERPGLVAARTNHRSVLLGNGKVLIIGGDDTALTASAHATCELYDPATNQSTPTGSMNYPRQQFSAVLLNDGRVMVAGGLTTTSASGSATLTSEIYDPAVGTWTLSNSLPAARYGTKAVLLNNNKVLLVGGADSSGTTVATAYLWDPGTTLWTATGSMVKGRQFFTLTKLATGDVFAVGGLSTGGDNFSITTDLYNVAGGTWTAKATLSTGRRKHSAVLLSNNKVLVTGGDISLIAATATTEIYDPAGNSWSAGGSLSAAVTDFSLVVLQDNTLFAQGGGIANTADAAGAAWSATDVPPINRATSTAHVLTSGKVIVAGGTNAARKAVAQATIYDPAAGGGFHFSMVGATVKQLALTLPTVGIAAVRTKANLQQLIVATGNNYTATSIAATLDSQLLGGSVATFRTTQLRVATDTFDISGDIAIVAADQEGKKLLLPTGSSVSNRTSHVPSITSANSDRGTPIFKPLQLISREPGGKVVVDAVDYSPLDVSGLLQIPSGSAIVGIRAYPETTTVQREGTDYAWTSQLLSVTPSAQNISSSLELRTTRELTSSDRFYAARQFSIGPADDVTVVLDQDDINKRFTTSLFRRLQTVGTTYGTTNTFKDADNGGQSLAVAFGFGAAGLDFSDFAVYMAGRTKSHPADATKTVLWRFNRLGPEGNKVRVRYDYPTAAAQAVQVRVNAYADDYVDCHVVLPSSAARTVPNIHNSTRLMGTTDVPDSGSLELAHFAMGFAVSSASRTTNVTTLTLTMPTGFGVFGHGLVAPEQIYVNSTDVNFSSGTKTITGVTTFTISYTEVAADQGASPNIGTVSVDTVGEASFASSTVQAGDIVYIKPTSEGGANITSEFTGIAIRITALGNQDFHGYIEWGTGTFDDQVVEGALLQTSNISFYPLNAATSTISAIVASVNTLAAAPNSLCPIRGTVIGSGATITRSSWEEVDVSGFYYQCSDGVNYVRSTTIPGSIVTDYQLVFKDPIAATLATSSDWASEQVVVAPINALGLAAWLNSSGASGLGLAGSVLASEKASCLQLTSITLGSSGSVQVQSGTGNSVSAAVQGSASFIDVSLAPPFTSTQRYMAVQVKASDAGGLFGGIACAIQNTGVLPRTTINSGTNLTTFAVDGTLTLNAGGTKAWTQLYTSTTGLQVDKQGRFACYSYDHLNGTLLNLTGVQEGDWVYISGAVAGTTTPMSSVNTGLWRIVRVDLNQNVFWIENPNALEEHTGARLVFIQDGSVLPGDTLSISTSQWGANNQGLWAVSSVGVVAGVPFSNQYIFNVDTSARTPQLVSTAGALGANSPLVQVIEGTPSRLIKTIWSISQNQASPLMLDVRFATGAGYARVSAVAGSLVQPLDKLGFTNSVINGIDGYAYSTGLIAEANKVLYSDPEDTATYPGVVAAQSTVNISGPLVKRVRIALSVRARTGVPEKDIINRVKSAVASLINATGIGKAIAISDIISAAGRVNGVLSVAIISPSFSAGTDLISVQPFEKPLVLDLDQDILVSLVS